uniref:Putative secreted protein n=1 Tax=Ixodes ricinus TaxID=34613 RepID=A0A6B0UDX6_IXORI
MGACVGLLGSLSFLFFFFYSLTFIYAVEKYPDTNARRTNRSRYMHYSRLLGLPMRTLPNLGRRCSVVSFAYALHTFEASQYAFRSLKRSDRCGVLQF